MIALPIAGPVQHSRGYHLSRGKALLLPHAVRGAFQQDRSRTVARGRYVRFGKCLSPLRNDVLYAHPPALTTSQCLHALLTGIIPPTPAPTLLSPRDRRSPGNAQGSSSSSSVHNSAGGPIPGTQAQLYAALSELLKSLFNLGLYYPRMADDMGSGKAKEDRAVLGEAFHPAFER